MAGDRRTELRADIVGEDRLSPAYSAAGRSVKDLSGKMEMAAQVSLALGEAFKRQRAAVRDNYGSVLELAAADEHLSAEERKLAASALEADVALRREAEAKKKSADAAKEAEARNKALRDSMKGLSFNPGIAGPALLAAPLAASLAGVGAGAALGLGGMFVAGGGALAAFGAIAKPVLADTLKAEQQVQAAQAKYNVAIANGANQAKAYAAEQKAIGKAYAELSPQQIALSKQLGAMASAWQDLKAKETPVVAGALQPWLKSVTDLTRNLAPIIARVSPVIGALGAQFDRLINSAAFKGFRDFIANTGSKVVGAVGGTLIDFVKAFMILLPKFNPLIMDMTHGIAGLGPAMLKWANSKSTADHITRFMDWFRQNGPVVRGLLKNVGDALKALAPGIGTASVAELNVISGFFGMIAKLPPGLAKPLTEVAGALLLLKNTGVISVGLKLGSLAGFGGSGTDAAKKAAGSSTGLWSMLLPGVRLLGGALVASVIIEAIGSSSLQKQGQKDPGVAPSFAHGIAVMFDQIRHETAKVWDLTWNNVVGRARRGVDDAFHQVSVMRHNFAGSFDQIRHDIASKWDATWNNTIGRARKGVDDAFKQVSNMRHNTASTFDNIRHDIASKWDATWSATISRLDRGRHDTAVRFDGVRHDTSGKWDSIRHDTASTWDSTWRSTISRLDQGRHDVAVRFDGIRHDASAKFADARGWLLSAGKNVIQGLWDGLTYVWNKVAGWISSLAGWIKKNKGPVSFDRTLLEPAGRALMQGLQVGLEGGFVGVKDIISGAAGSISNSFSGLFSLGGKVASFFSNLFGGGGSGGSGVNRWSGLVHAALSMLHLPQSLAGRVLYQMQTESGGNPNAVNLQDSNARAGHPSQGLMQVIPGTFAAYHVGGTSWNIRDPLANIAAAINYARHVYGPSLGALGSGHGYAFGTMSAAPGWAWVGEHGPELMHFRGGEQVIPSGAARGGGATYVINVAAAPLARPADIGREVVGAIREHEKRAGIGWRS